MFYDKYSPFNVNYGNLLRCKLLYFLCVLQKIYDIVSNVLFALLYTLRFIILLRMLLKGQCREKMLQGRKCSMVEISR
jgi:hypothetical protein